MPAAQHSLLALQEIDREIDTGRRRIAALQAELAGGGLDAARAAAEAARSELVAARTGLAAAERALETLDATIIRLDRRLYDGSIHNAREAAGVEEELAHRRREREATEDAVIAAMERQEAAQAALAAAEQGLRSAEDERGARDPALKAEGRALVARVKSLQEQRAALASAAPPRLLETYERLRATARPAVVRVHAGSCGGCGVALSSSVLQRIAADEIVRCANCTRLLVEEGPT